MAPKGQGQQGRTNRIAIKNLKFNGFPKVKKKKFVKQFS
jgi:hypothetical protein